MGGSANRRHPEVVAHAVEITKLCIEREKDKREFSFSTLFPAFIKISVRLFTDLVFSLSCLLFSEYKIYVIFEIPSVAYSVQENPTRRHEHTKTTVKIAKVKISK